MLIKIIHSSTLWSNTSMNFVTGAIWYLVHLLQFQWVIMSDLSLFYSKWYLPVEPKIWSISWSYFSLRSPMSSNATFPFLALQLLNICFIYEALNWSICRCLQQKSFDLWTLGTMFLIMWHSSTSWITVLLWLLMTFTITHHVLI